MLKLNDEKKNLMYLFLISLAILVLILTIRFAHNPHLIGSESYSNLKESDNLFQNGISNIIQLLGDSEYTFNFIHLFLFKIPTNVIFLMIIPVILGLSSVFLFVLILINFKINSKLIYISTGFYIFSPIFLKSFTTLSSSSFISFFVLLGAWFFIKKRLLLSSVSISPLIFINPPIMILTIISFFIFGLAKNINKKLLLINSLILLFITLVSYFALYYGKFIPNLFFFENNRLLEIISDFGANGGITAFHILLSIIGFIIIWSKKREQKPYFLSLLLISTISIYVPNGIILMNFIVCYFSGYLFYLLYISSWELKSIKDITLMLIIYGVLFSSISFGVRLIESTPTIDQIEGLTFLNDKSPGVVLSHYSNGNYIKYFSNKEILLDDSIFFIKDYNLHLNKTNEIFYSRNIENTISGLNEMNIKYFFIDGFMKDGLVWEKRNEGLLFLLDHSNEFNQIYKKNNIEIWEFLNLTST